VNLSELKAQWNEVLFTLEPKNRVAWLTFFDARLAEFDGTSLRLDFSDPEKFSGDHSYAAARDKFKNLLIETIEEITGEKVEVTW
jgi:hypothetical protein